MNGSTIFHVKLRNMKSACVKLECCTMQSTAKQYSIHACLLSQSYTKPLPVFMSNMLSTMPSRKQHRITVHHHQLLLRSTAHRVDIKSYPPHGTSCGRPCVTYAAVCSDITVTSPNKFQWMCICPNVFGLDCYCCGCSLQTRIYHSMRTIRHGLTKLLVNHPGSKIARYILHNGPQTEILEFGGRLTTQLPRLWLLDPAVYHVQEGTPSTCPPDLPCH